MNFKKVLILIFIALLTFGVIFIIRKPEVLGDFWLWIVGLGGAAYKAVQKLWSIAKEKMKLGSDEDDKGEDDKRSKNPTQAEIGYPFSQEMDVEDEEELTRIPILEGSQRIGGQVPVSRRDTLGANSNLTIGGGQNATNTIVKENNGTGGSSTIGDRNNTNVLDSNSNSNTRANGTGIITLNLDRQIEEGKSTIGQLKFANEPVVFTIEGPAISTDKLEQRISAGTYPLELFEPDNTDKGTRKMLREYKMEGSVVRVEKVKNRANIFIKTGKNTSQCFGGILLSTTHPAFLNGRKWHRVEKKDTAFSSFIKRVEDTLAAGTELQLVVRDIV